jgi:hypothetical protein
MREMSNQQRTILVAAVAAIVGFGIGALWQYASARSYSQRLDTVETTYTFQRLEATLGAATIEAQRGSFEIARQLASDFFTDLQANAARAPVGQQQVFRDILQNRDAMITALSRSDQQSGSLLAQLFTRFRIARGEPVGPDGRTAPAPGMPAPPDTASAAADSPAPPPDGPR